MIEGHKTVLQLEHVDGKQGWINLNYQMTTVIILRIFPKIAEIDECLERPYLLCLYSWIVWRSYVSRRNPIVVIPNCLSANHGPSTKEMLGTKENTMTRKKIATFYIISLFLHTCVVDQLGISYILPSSCVYHLDTNLIRTSLGNVSDPTIRVVPWLVVDTQESNMNATGGEHGNLKL